MQGRWMGIVFGIIMLVAATVGARSDTDSVESVEYVYTTTSTDDSMRSVEEAQSVRVKLATAEERVKSLVSKLDAVSEDATRARMEIHSTLVEAWTIVDILGKDRCGDAVLQVRKKQQAAEARLAELEVEASREDQTAGEFEGIAKRLSIQTDDMKQKVQTERSKREQIESELDDVKQRLKYALTLTNRSDVLGSVQAHLKQISIKISERTEHLKQVLQILKVDLESQDSMETILGEVKTSILDQESEFSSSISSLNVDKSQVADIDKKYTELKNKFNSITRDRQDAVKSIENMQKHITALKEAGKTVVKAAAPSKSSLWSTLALILISIVFGALLVLLGTRNMPGPVNFPRDVAGNRSSSPGYYGSQVTPGSAGATPHPSRLGGNRGETPNSDSKPVGSPESGFYHSDRSPMTYVRSGASPSYRDY